MLCKFEATDSSRCGSSVQENEEYCSVHAALLKDERKVRIYERIGEQLGYRISDICDESEIIDGLGADSLDTVDLVQTVEEELNVIVPDDVAEEVVTVGDFCDLVLSGIVDKTMFRKRRNERGLSFLLSQDLFKDYLRIFDITGDRLNQIMLDTIGNDAIQHVTTVPNVDGESSIPSTCHIIILTKQKIYFYELSHRSIFFRSFFTIDLGLDTAFKFDEEGNLKSVDISGVVGEANVDGRAEKRVFHYVFREQVGVDGAWRFLKKLDRNVRGQ